MKKVIFYCLSFLFVASSIQAQVKYSEEGKADGKHPAFSIMVQNVTPDEAAEVWEDYAKDIKAKAKFDKSTNEYFSDDAKLKSLSENTVDVYARILPFGDEQQLVVWFDLGGAYLNETDHAGKMDDAKEILLGYQVAVKRFLLEKELDMAEDELKDAEKDLKSVSKDIRKLEDDIQDYKEKLAEAEKELEAAKQMKPEKEEMLKMKKSKVREIEEKMNKL